MCAKFESNPITYVFTFYSSFLQVCEKNKQSEQLFKGSYFRNAWPDLLLIWYVFSPNMPASAQQIWSYLD